MKRIFCTALITLGVLTAAVAAQSPNVVGTWDITIDSPQGQNKAMLMIKKDGDKLSGAMKSARGERPIESVALAGNDITFVMKANVQGQDMVFTYKGKVEKDSMKGDVDFGGLATGNWSAVPHQEGAAAPAAAAAAAPQAGGMNVTGEWNFSVETSAGSGNPSFTFKQEGENLTGTYKGQLGEGPLTGTVKGSEIKFTIKLNTQGQDLSIVYTGTIENKDSMKGKVMLGELGEGTWTGKRK